MADLLAIDNFKGMVPDAPDGKQPEGTCKEIKNLVYDREYGSLVTRYTYENSLARPTGVSTLDKWLTFPTTYPDKNDNHVWFTEDGIFIQPYYHNSSTLTQDWKLITESKSLSSISSSDVTVNASPTNTVVIANATTTWGLSSTNNYYKNWVFQGTGGNTEAYLVKSYAVSGSTATFTLDNVLSINWAVIPDYGLYRYFHKDYSFSPAYTYPAGYSTELGYRWSGGAGSTTGLKNIKSGYINKVFFNNSGTTHTFTGTYVDQAECFAPSSAILTTSSFTEAYASDKIIKLSKDYDFDNVSSTDWTGAGGFTASVGSSTITAYFSDVFGGFRTVEVPINGLLIKTNGTEGDTTTNYVELASNGTYLESITSGSTYTFKIKGFSADASGKSAKVKVRISKSDDSVSYDSAEMTLLPDNDFTPNSITSSRISSGEFSFSATFTGIPKIRIYLVDTAYSGSYSAVLTNVTLSLTSNISIALDYGYTYKLWGSYVYDGFQESELTYLGAKYITGKNSKLAYEINQKLGSLNKFISGIRLYMSKEAGDTTSATTTTVAPRYLMNDIRIDDSASSTWTFDTSQGRYEYASSFTGLSWANRGVTWEQKTGRTASTSTTCSYFLATQASGRIFLADDYDYADGKLSINRVRYTGFNGDGAPTPDIFPNIPDVFITTITAGKSQEIRNIVEYEGDVIILKKSSILRLDTSNPNPFTWELRLIKDGVGSRSAQGAYKFDKGLFFTDLYSAYLYDGYQVRDVLKGRWRNLYQSLVTTDAKATSQRVWYNPVNDTIAIAYDTSTDSKKYYEFNTDSWLPVLMQNATGYDLNNVVTTSDGVVHFAPTSVGANAFKISTVVGTPLVDVSIDTGYRDVQKGYVGHAKWVYFLAESPISGSTIVATLYGDGSSLTSGTFTPTTSAKTLYKMPLSQDIPCKMFKVTLSQTGAVAPSTQQFKLHKVWVAGDIVPEATDVTLLPA